LADCAFCDSLLRRLFLWGGHGGLDLTIECVLRMSELSETAQPDDLRGLRILLVEDSPVVADALKQHLGLLGATVAGPS
jgi:hypothetical protein